ncbi:MAG TPA: hypothetical protein VG389_14440, partial [Myxococcota bacterium]|nr:hypothetical protein [Myxococcota bacterium]
LLGVSATDPDIVLWLVDGVTDAVYRSDDGGATALSVFEPLGPFGAFTVGTDGTMYATTLSGMLYRSTDDGLTWMENGGGTPAATALDEIGGRLYAVTNRLATCGFALMYSEDQGDSFTGFYQLPDTGGVLATCAPGTPAHTLCDPLWPAVAAELGIGTDAGMTAACTDAGNAPGTDAGVDAGGGDGGGGKHCGGCAVAAPVGRHGRAPVAAAAALAALLLATRLAPRRRSARRCAATRP